VFPLGYILWDKYLGDVVYAVVFYLGICLILGYRFLSWKIGITAVYVTSIELFQLTAIPSRLNHSAYLLVKLLAYVVLGSTFSWLDLLAYAIGIGLMFIVDRRLSSPTAQHALTDNL